METSAQFGSSDNFSSGNSNAMEHKALLSVHAGEATQCPADPLAVLTKGLFRAYRHFCLPAAGCCFLKCAFQTKKRKRSARAKTFQKFSGPFSCFQEACRAKRHIFPRQAAEMGRTAVLGAQRGQNKGEGAGGDSPATSAQPLCTGASRKRK